MEDDQQFCLRWNNHQSTLVAVFDTLLEKGNLVDCTLAAEGKFLNAHKVVLSACSPYFEALLSQNYDKHPIFILKDVKFQELKAMMDYMYRGEVNISQDQLGALLKAAESLQIKGLSDNKKGDERRPPQQQQPPQSRSPPPGPSIPRVQGLTIEQRKREADDSLSREGSQSPGMRRKKRNRRKSEDNLDNHHELSNSSESHHSNQTPAQNIPATIPATKITNVPEPLETKTEITTPKMMNDSTNSQVPTLIEKIETHSELMIEPKSEYEEVNEDSIEDLTLDEDDLTNMEDMDDQGAGPSHGNVGEGSGQGFGSWHMGNQNQDEVFLAASEAVGANRDAQEDIASHYSKEEFFENFRLSKKIVKDLTEKFQKSRYFSDQGGKHIPALDQILMYLWYMGHQTNFREIAISFHVTLSSVNRIIRRVTSFINSLSSEIIKWPTDEEKQISEAHFRANGFPNVIGAIDGTHIKIDKPEKDSDSYKNQKGYYSIKMQVVCDHRCKILDVFVGCPGSVHDSQVFRISPLGNDLEEKCGTYFILGDGGYPVHGNLLTPYVDKGTLTITQKNYNLKLAKNLYIIDHCLATLKQKFRQIYYIKLKNILIVDFIRAACILHNISLEDNVIASDILELPNIINIQISEHQNDLNENVEIEDVEARAMKDTVANALQM